ncbi:MAG: hypothetical protein LBG60_08765 [Bifidobacteriaceae bacterium]|jgi:hypothetical protein|nr:hypothetical protein [Bifidobacteriaceae bacterium]
MTPGPTAAGGARTGSPPVTGRPSDTGSPLDIGRRAAAVPPKTDFPLLDELAKAFEDLAARHPNLVATRRLGRSRDGQPINLHVIGRGQGRLAHLVVGGVHPNEPIGSWTALHLAEQLIQDPAMRQQLDASWGIIPCVDPDGYRLNEGWLKNPADRLHYAEHFFRPAPDDQVEWTFPFHYKRAHFDAMMPETRALKEAIDLMRPDLYVALHNSELGGVYYYLSRAEPELYPALHAIPQALGIPLDEGEPESGHLVALAPAIFAETSLEDAYDWMESLGLDPCPPGSGGASSGQYASRAHGALSLIAELPYWRDARASDTRLTQEAYADLLERTGQRTADLGAVLTQAADEARDLLDWTTPLAHGARAFAQMMGDAAGTARARGRQPEARRPATAAERFGCEETVRMFQLRYGGMMLRALGEGLAGSPDPAALAAVADRLERHCEGWRAAAAADDASEPIPIADLVGVQYGAILAAAALLAGRLAP